MRAEMNNPEISHLWADLNELVQKETALQNDITRTMELWENAVEAEKRIED